MLGPHKLHSRSSLGEILEEVTSELGGGNRAVVEGEEAYFRGEGEVESGLRPRRQDGVGEGERRSGSERGLVEGV